MFLPEYLTIYLKVVSVNVVLVLTYLSLDYMIELKKAKKEARESLQELGE